MKLGLSGSRSLVDGAFISELLDFVCKEYELKPTEVIHGGAEGFDQLAGIYFYERFGIHPEVIRPIYKNYPDEMKWKAPLDRNTVIVEKCDCLLAVWSGAEVNGRKGGTRDTRDKAIGRKKPTIFVNVKGRRVYSYNGELRRITEF